MDRTRSKDQTSALQLWGVGRRLGPQEETEKTKKEKVELKKQAHCPHWAPLPYANNPVPTVHLHPLRSSIIITFSALHPTARLRLARLRSLENLTPALKGSVFLMLSIQILPHFYYK